MKNKNGEAVARVSEEVYVRLKAPSHAQAPISAACFLIIGYLTAIRGYSAEAAREFENHD